MNEMDHKESLSALADGQLDAAEAAQCLQAIAHDDEAVLAWRSYQLIGEVLRSGGAGALPASSVFAAGVVRRLAQEPLAPARPPQAPQEVLPPAQPGLQRGKAANDGVFFWKLVAGLASVAAFTAVGWTLLASGAPSTPAPALAAAPAATVAAGTVGQMIRDPRLDELMAAHRQLGGATALQSSSGFLRNATFDTAAR